MEDHQRTLSEFERRLDTEAACQAYLATLRCPDGVVQVEPQPYQTLIDPQQVGRG